ncbi:MAG: hypothetical protein ACI976_000393 [Aureispira sp.]|jgi:hypothetical protein
MRANFRANYYLYFFLFVYVFLLGMGLTNHEFWMDESHHWLIARDSNSLFDLFDNYRYDGHPMLWVFCLWVLACFTSKVVFVQVFHALIAVCTVALILFKAPFRKRYSILFIFGYYPLFEYGMLSRNYALTIFFLLLFCVFYEKNKSVLLPFFLLGLAANSHLFGFIFSVLLVAKIVYQEKKHLKRHLAALGLFVLMALFAIITIKAPSDHFFYFNVARLFNFSSFGGVLSMWWKAICPIPDLMSTNFWNTNFLTVNYKLLGLLAVLFSWFLPLFVLKRKSSYYLIFYGYAGLLIGFCLLTGLNISQRIGGFLLFALVVLIWLEEKEYTENPAIITINKTAKRVGLYLFLLVQLFSAGVFWAAEINRPFSNTKNIYQLLAENIDKRTVVYAGLYCNYIGINNYGDLKVYISSQDQLKYCDWRTLKTNQGKVFWEEALNFMRLGQYDRVIVLRTEKVIHFDFPEYTISLLGQFKNGMVKNENAYIYVIKKRE